jgi:hypothetical protein
MNRKNLIISPQTKVGELLDAYPELEKVLFELSPAFAKLKNPILRKTIARIATLQQAAVVGKLKVDDLVNRLRKEVGLELFSGTAEQGKISEIPPDWFEESKITIRFNAIPIINAGNSPMAEIISQASLLGEGDIFELKAPFIPAPIIDKLKEKGFEAWSVQKGEIVLNYFRKSKQE